MLCVNYILSTYVEYYEKNGIEEERVLQFKNIQEKITIASFVFISLGFSLYFNEKYNDFGKDFFFNKIHIWNCKMRQSKIITSFQKSF